jgi:hypothetical protein
MAQPLRIALLHRHPGWEILLDWTGIPWRLVHSVSDLKESDYVVAVVNRHLWNDEFEAVDAYARSGGAVLDTGRFFSRVERQRYRRSFIGHLRVPAPDRATVGFPVIDISGVVKHQVGQPPFESATAMQGHGNGWVIDLGFDPGLLMADARARFRQFPADGPAMPIERVCRIAKGEIGSLLFSLLRRLFVARNLPMVRKHPFPSGAGGVFAFRVDSDYGSRAEIDALADVRRNAGVPFTWFVHTGAHAGWLNRFADMDSDEVAVHGERHRTFRRIEPNLQNMSRAREQLRHAGMDPVGFAAPTGAWNHGLARAVDEAGFLYSSEFALAWSALPFRPILPVADQINRYHYDAVQIPIHPISVGHLARSGANDRETNRYFECVAERAVRAGRPVIFYHHPTHRRWHLVEHLLETPERLGIPAVTFAEWAHFWKRRSELWFDVTQNGNSFEVDRIVGNPDDDIRLEILEPNGTVRTASFEAALHVEDAPISTRTNANNVRVSAEDPCSSGGDDRRQHTVRSLSLQPAKRALIDFVTKIRR